MPRIDRWSRRFVATSAVFLVAWQVSAVMELSSQTRITLALLGFVLHIVFGKAYTLIPSYFSCELSFESAPAVHLPLSVSGTLLLAYESSNLPTRPAGAVLWFTGVVVFSSTLVWTLRDNITGRETGTSDANQHRKKVDRYANLFMPFALVYLVAGSYELVAMNTVLPTVFDGYFPRAAHLLAAGTAALLVFSIGFRLLPHFLVTTPPRYSVLAVLPAGAVAPALLATFLNDGTGFIAGALLEATAVVGFALVYLAMYLKSERRRVGFYSILAGVSSGVIAVAFGLYFAFAGLRGNLAVAHARLNLLGFLGLTIMGVAYQFYPPRVGSFRG
ncbi:MAG: hypothetical protein SXQ77_08075, partial [Halobacteria archaeon]|nr:hypothetical protein [Halobacteria archaeon]